MENPNEANNTSQTSAFPDPKDSLTKSYKMRTVGHREATITVTVPKDMIIRQAKRAGISLEEYLETYRAVAHFDDSEGLYYTFEKVKQQKPGYVDPLPNAT